MLILATPVLWAQTAPNRNQGPAAKISILIDRQVVRFLAQGEALEWRLVVSNQQGAVIYDSGLVNGTSLDWPFQDSRGEVVASGLYAYTLATKAATEEAARTQQGHLIIDRASRSDRVWVTSSQALGIGSGSEGATVSVIGSGETTVGGAELSGPIPTRAALGPRTTAKREATIKAEEQKAPVAAATSGTANRIAKFAADGATLVDSTVSETASGDLGIGTAAPGGVLDLQRASSSDILQRFWNTGTGGAKLRYVAGTGQTSQVQLTDNAEWLMSIAGNNSTGMQFRVRDPGDANNEATLAASARMTILRNGNVGIGTSNPLRTLQIGGSLNAAFTFEQGVSPNAGYIRFGDSTGWKLHFGRNRESGGGPLNIGTTGVLMTLQDNGDVLLGRLSDATNSSPYGTKLAVVAEKNSSGHGKDGMLVNGGASGSDDGGTGIAAYGGNVYAPGAFGGTGIFAQAGLTYDPDTGARSGFAAFFQGGAGVDVNGSLFVSGSKDFKIDHPLDPENKYLLHAAIESSEVLNVYSGNVTTDQSGSAVVELPDWFEALNKDFRYQLTVVNTFAQAIIAEKIKGNRFVIKTNVPGVEVSWQVTGVRSDALMLKHPFQAEEDKPQRERGTYRSPEVFGQPEEKGMVWARYPELMRQMKEQREQAQREKLRKEQP